MPLAPYHIGPGLFIPLLLMNIVDLPTFLVASVIVDVEPILILFFGSAISLHGFLHSYVEGSIVALILSIAMLKSRKFFSSLTTSFKLEQKWSGTNISIASFLGIYLHIFLDAQMH